MRLLMQIKAIDLFPGDNEAHNLGNNYKSLRKLKEAERCYKEAIKLKPDYVDANYNMAATSTITAIRGS